MSISVSYASGPSDKPLLGSTIPEFFDNIVHKHGDRDAVISLHQGLRFTYKELAQEVNVLAKAFLSAGFLKPVLSW